MTDLLYPYGWNLLIAAVMAMAVWLACRTHFLRRRPAVCHGLWLLVLLKLVTPPVLSVPVLPAVVAQEQREVAAVTSAAPTPSVGCDITTPVRDESDPFEVQSAEISDFCCPTATAEVTATPSIANASEVMQPWTWKQFGIGLLGISLFVSCVLGLASAYRFFQVRRLLRGSACESSRAADLLREVSRRFDLRSSVKLHVVNAPITPMLWALPGNPAIVLPRDLVDSLGNDELRNIFAHELGHYVRRDHWTNLFAQVVVTLFWWNPISWFARRQLSAAAEVCCDTMAVERLRGSRKSYATTLLTVVDSLTPTAPLRSALGISFGESQSLRRRFESIADANVKGRVTRTGWIVLVLGCMALTLVPARAQDESAAQPKKQDSEQVQQELDAPQQKELGDIQCRLIAVSTSTDDEKPGEASSTNKFAAGEDVTFVVELKNVSSEPITLLGVRYGDSYGKSSGKLATSSRAPHLFDFEFVHQDGSPIHRSQRVFVDSVLHLFSASTHELEPGQSLSVVLRPAKFASPMDYRLAPGTYRAKVRYHGLSDKSAARMKEVRPDKPVANSWRGEVTSNEVAFTIADDPRAPKQEELQWGDAKDGLRAAVELRPRNEIASTTELPGAVPLGSALQPIIHVQNVSDRPISLVSETWRQGDTLAVRNEAGNLREVGGSLYTGWDTMVRWTLKPGEVAEMKSADVGVVGEWEISRAFKHPIGRRCVLKPGSYTFQYTVRLGYQQQRDGKGNTILPGPDDWQGTLVTGETLLTVRERTPADDADQ